MKKNGVNMSSRLTGRLDTLEKEPTKTWQPSIDLNIGDIVTFEVLPKKTIYQWLLKKPAKSKLQEFIVTWTN